MSCRLETSFIGFPHSPNLNGRKRGSLGYRYGVRILKRDTYKFKCSKKDDWVSRGANFTHHFGRNVQMLWKNFALRSGGLMYSVKEPLVLSKSLVKSMVPLWQERLLLLRSPAFYVVISGVFLLFWYSLRKAKSYAETKLLPSVCASLSDYIQRDIDFGKVRGISPLSITLESCSIGPHSEEFSCGEVPSVKIRILPFASLRNRKIVIDAVLSNPSVLIAQKKNFTFLGIPFSEGSLQRHLSDEEGIDYRTKTRRIAREESAARWARERDNAAREAAEKGYVVREWISCLSEDDFSKDGVSLENLATTESFFCMDEKLHWRARHSADTGGEYDMKHADLEKAFGVKIPPGATFWSRIIPPAVKHKFKKANGKDLSAASVAAKSRILERSASAARIYFQALSNGNCGNCTLASENFEAKSDMSSLVKSDGGTTAVSEEVVTSADYAEGIKAADNSKLELFMNDSRSKEPRQNLKSEDICGKILGGYLLPGDKLDSGCIGSIRILCDPFLFTLSRLCKTTNLSEKLSVMDVTRLRETSRRDINSEEIEAHIINRDASAIWESNWSNGLVQESHSGPLGSRRDQSLNDLNFRALDSFPVKRDLEKVGLFSLKSVLNNMREAVCLLITNPLNRLNLEMSPRMEDISELAEDVEEDVVGIEKSNPVILDSVHFRGGTLMLLAYGDTEPR